MVPPLPSNSRFNVDNVIFAPVSASDTTVPRKSNVIVIIVVSVLCVALLVSAFFIIFVFLKRKRTRTFKKVNRDNNERAGLNQNKKYKISSKLTNLKFVQPFFC